MAGEWLPLLLLLLRRLLLFGLRLHKSSAHYLNLARTDPIQSNPIQSAAVATSQPIEVARSGRQLMVNRHTIEPAQADSS